MATFNVFLKLRLVLLSHLPCSGRFLSNLAQGRESYLMIPDILAVMKTWRADNAKLTLDRKTVSLIFSKLFTPVPKPYLCLCPFPVMSVWNANYALFNVSTD